MSKELTLLCDFRIPDKRRYRVCNERVPNNEPTEFSLGNEVYLADLCDRHKLALAEALAPFIEIASTGSVKVGHLLRKALEHFDGTKFTLADARAWLLDNGFEVADRGMIRKELIDEYQAAYEAANK